MFTLTLPRLLRTDSERALPVRVERCERERPDIERAEPVRVERSEREESGETRADGRYGWVRPVSPSTASPQSSQ